MSNRFALPTAGGLPAVEISVEKSLVAYAHNPISNQKPQKFGANAGSKPSFSKGIAGVKTETDHEGLTRESTACLLKFAQCCGIHFALIVTRLERSVLPRATSREARTVDSGRERGLYFCGADFAGCKAARGVPARE